eukprot:m51a1_g3284 hypothetical protein (145) ;mRNA; r:260968-261562
MPKPVLFIALIALAACASAVGGVVAPRDVYSAVIHNPLSEPIAVEVVYERPDGTTERDATKIAPEDSYTFEQRTHTEGSATFTSFIASVKVWTASGEEVTLPAPFEGVHSPVQLQHFTVSRPYRGEQSKLVLSLGEPEAAQREL